jgi:hypothetical protein
VGPGGGGPAPARTRGSRGGGTCGELGAGVAQLGAGELGAQAGAAGPAAEEAWPLAHLGAAEASGVPGLARGGGGERSLS